MRFACNKMGAKNGLNNLCPSTKIPQKRAKRVLVVASFFIVYRYKNCVCSVEMMIYKNTARQSRVYFTTKTRKLMNFKILLGLPLGMIEF